MFCCYPYPASSKFFSLPFGKIYSLGFDFYLDSFQIAYFCVINEFDGMTADQIPLSGSARIEGLSESPYKVNLMELGFLPGKIITLQHRAPSQGPLAFKLDETVLALRKQEAAVLQVTLITALS